MPLGSQRAGLACLKHRLPMTRFGASREAPPPTHACDPAHLLGQVDDLCCLLVGTLKLRRRLGHLPQVPQLCVPLPQGVLELIDLTCLLKDLTCWNVQRISPDYRAMQSADEAYQVPHSRNESKRARVPHKSSNADSKGKLSKTLPHFFIHN